MAVRNEYVRLSLDDDFTTGMARATAATALFRKALGGLDGDSIDLGDSLGDAAVGMDRVGRSSRTASPEIDRLSGRLRIFRDAAITLGPALIPLGAAAIPALTGSLAALGSAAGGLGVSILALKGVGDALGALNDYQLEPTAENLQAARIEMEKLGPAGAHFAQYLDGISSELKTLQTAARNGLLPGLEDGIDLALERLPGVRKIIRELARGMAELSVSAGGDLAPGGGFDEFFRYLDTDAQDTLVSFGNAIGDITNGLADMMVAFAPLNRDFTQGFEGMAQSFADWADGLNESQDFAAFLDYLRTNGPRAIDMLGSLANALADIVQAAAPVGAATLPILTKFLDVIGALASSPLGTPFIAALAAVTAYSRAVTIATAAQVKFAGVSKASIAASGPLIAVAALTVATIEYADALDRAEEAVRGWEDALAAGTLTVADMKAQIAALEEDLDSDSFGEYLKNSFDPDVWVDFTKRAFGARTEVDHMKSQASLLAGEMEILGAQTKNTGDLADLFGAAIGQSGDQMRIAAGDATALEGALASLNGWFDKRQSIRDYNASIRELSRSMRNGFTRADVENLDQIGRNIAQVASQITNPSKRAAFLENARTQLEALAEKGGPKAQAAIDQVVRKLESLGLVKVEPTIDANSKPAEDKIAKAKKQFDIFGALSASGTLDANANPFFGVFNPAQAALNRFDGQTATAYLNVVRRGVTNAAAEGVGPAAINESPRTTAPRISSGRVTGRTSAPTSLTFGRGEDKAAMYGGMFGGGVVQLDNAAKDAAAAVKGVAFEFTYLQSELRKAEKTLEKERRQRDDLVAASQAFAEAVGSAYASANPFAGGLADFDAATSANTNDTNAANAALAAAAANGLDGGLYQALAASGNLSLLQEFASLTAAQIDIKEQQFAAQVQAQAALGESAADREYKQLIRDQTKVLRAAEKAVQNLEARVERGAERGTRAGHNDQNVTLATRIRTGG